MQKRIYSWLGREFIELSGEVQAGSSVEEETNDLFRRFEEELKSHGLSLQNIVRTRIWGRDREVRPLATAARSKILTGSAKAASSSYISPQRFDSDAKMALDLLAMRASRPDAERNPLNSSRLGITFTISAMTHWLFSLASLQMLTRSKIRCQQF